MRRTLATVSASRGPDVAPRRTTSNRTGRRRTARDPAGHRRRDMANDIHVYGTDWCGLTFGVREYLTTSRLEYDYYNVDRDPRAQEFVLAMNDGRLRLPMVVV